MERENKGKMDESSLLLRRLHCASETPSHVKFVLPYIGKIIFGFKFPCKT
ncbi:hypothetical protein RchiOBHm_Chr6g0276361 [Rosa chinensis]|uniref:Uncharacterized protein n=1 Tax=Rosa chinensis TaxID=74649 RepID=A0A2P6PS97_ROSCH|nr:hypothetical protein RchiOBHm_Chr6g0276361 [Rosa chinensis]